MDNGFYVPLDNHLTTDPTAVDKPTLPIAISSALWSYADKSSMYRCLWTTGSMC